MVRFNRPKVGLVTPDRSIILSSQFYPLNFTLNETLKFLRDPQKGHNKLLPIHFFRKKASVDNSWLLISSLSLLMVAGKALDVMENRVVQIFYHINIGGFLMFPLGRGKLNTSPLPIKPTATPLTIGNQNKKQGEVENRF